MLKIKSIPNVVQQGIRTYDYILTMREESSAEDFLDESDILSTPSSPASSVDSFDDHHKNTNFFSKFSCLSNHQRYCEETRRVSLNKHDIESELPKTQKASNANIDINPWRLMKLSKKEVVRAAERRGESAKAASMLTPLPQERKCGPAMNAAYVALHAAGEMEAMPLLMQSLAKPKPKTRDRSSSSSYTSVSLPVFSSASIASPRLPCARGRDRATSKSLSFTSPLLMHHRTNFDLGITEVSAQLQTYISKQVVSSLFTQGSPVQ